MVKKSLLLAIQLAFHLDYMALIPLILFGGLGLVLDRQEHTLPRFLLIGITLAFVTTMYWIATRLREIIKN